MPGSRNDQRQKQIMNLASNSVIEITRYPETSPINARIAKLDVSISANSSATNSAFNNLINISAILILSALLIFLELHMRRSMLHSNPAVISIAKDAMHGFSLPGSAQLNAVE